jgi:tRNA threonylcarbamoyladenosine biosynthesis protein TsaE
VVKNKVYTRSVEETVAFGQRLGSSVAPGTILCLFGDLGAGKTTLIKGIINSLTAIAPEEVCSPTFTYLITYQGKCPVYHFDLYRLKCAEDFLSLGFEEYLFAHGVCCIEWSERIVSILPENTHKITLTHASNGKRTICYEVSKC